MHNVDEKEIIEQEKRIEEKMAKVKHTLIVMSGKGAEIVFTLPI